MRCFIPAAVLAMLFGISPLLRSQDEIDNPYRNSNVGDWTEYVMSSPLIAGKTKMTVVAKDDKELTYETAVTTNGKDTPAANSKHVIDLTKPHDPVAAANMKATGVKSERLSEGTEKIKVGAKEYDTKWIKIRTTAVANEITVVSEGKMWFCKDVPLSGLVKMQMATGGVATTMELVGSGSK